MEDMHSKVKAIALVTNRASALTEQGPALFFEPAMAQDLFCDGKAHLTLESAPQKRKADIDTIDNEKNKTL
ncbi:hypothetical protein E6O75_ATG00021 [Venturia nashicola]|uniref:Uncharacterized protein n=1 Tax=Venturia nashicola TaxID=86259 RepID=A0A4Z1PMK7_9PEZI|nr:hypothetical protein E6O75_ATG00021 [Venturia nashicola]